MKYTIMFIIIVLISMLLRAYNLNWDQNHHLHPDERFLTMVAGAMKWPTPILEYFDTAKSPLNPHNIGYNFYVYGTFPVILTKFIAEGLKSGGYNELTIIGRSMSAIFDIGTAILVFFVAKKISKNNVVGLWAMFFYGISVLPIQLSHFFAVDTYSTFFITLSFLLLIINSPLAGIALGLAMACKITAGLFLVIPGLYFLKNKQFLLGVIFLILTIVTLRIAQPYLFTNLFNLNPKVLDNWKQLKSFDNPDGWFPPAVVWTKTIPYLFPLKNLVLWGLGIPLAFLSLGSAIYHAIKSRNFLIWLMIVWIIGLFTYQGGQFVKALRYFIHLYPFLAIFGGLVIVKFSKRIKLLILIGVCIWPLSFMTIYTRPHSRVLASQWIYENIPAGSILSHEHWDDALPLYLSNYPINIYAGVELPLYDPDSSEKWQDINKKLESVDYLITSSNRLYDSIPKVPEKYPLTARFYNDLFDGKTNFVKVTEITSRPGWFVDDHADETFTVYDHPRVLIFKNMK